MVAEQRHTEFAAAPPGCAPGVCAMIGYRGLALPETVHRGLPSAALTFIVSLDDGVEAADTLAGLAGARPTPVLLAGLHTRASRVRQRRRQAGVQIAVHPLASRALFGVPAAELSVTDYDATAVLGGAPIDLHARLTETTGWAQAFGTVAEYLAATRRDTTAVRPEVAHAWWLLERHGGRVRVAALADRVGVSPRHLTTLFRREVGHSPKTVAALMRFTRARTQIAEAARGTGVDLAAIALEVGYSDQAHLTREFARFAGIAPRRWLAEEFRNIQDGGHADPSPWAHEHTTTDGQPHGLADPAGP